MTPAQRLEAAGMHLLPEAPELGAVARALRTLVGSLNGSGPLDVQLVRQGAVARLQELQVGDARRLVDAALAERKTVDAPAPLGTVALRDPEPWPDPVNGAALLARLTDWLSAYVHLPPHAAAAVALWITATWCVGVIDYAALLVLLSATKRCGKSLLLDLVGRVVRRGYTTSGTGITTAVVFRLNELSQPTLCIDEAEKLAGRHADRDLIGMLNAGYRRGARVQRCVERNGDFEIREFAAFGFRALAAIGHLWDTILDRGIVIHLERKPKGATVRRFAHRLADEEGVALSRQLRRWAIDAETAVAEALLTAPRPDWLNDRAADNWAALFAVAAVVGDPWPARALAAAEVFEAASDERDHAELLVHDLWRLWNTEQWSDAIASGELVERLKEIETSPWGSYRDGRGLTTHGLAALLKPLGLRPRQSRNLLGAVVRGYWLVDLEPLYRRYPPSPQVVQLVRLLLTEGGRAWRVPPVPVVPEGAEGEDPDEAARAAMQEGA